MNEHEIKISQRLVKSYEKYKQKHMKFEDVITSRVSEGKNLYLKYEYIYIYIYKYVYI